MTRASERSSPPLSWFQALDQFLVTQTSGRNQVREGSASADPLKEDQQDVDGDEDQGH